MHSILSCKIHLVLRAWKTSLITTTRMRVNGPELVKLLLLAPKSTAIELTMFMKMHTSWWEVLQETRMVTSRFNLLPIKIMRRVQMKKTRERTARDKEPRTILSIELQIGRKIWSSMMAKEKKHWCQLIKLNTKTSILWIWLILFSRRQHRSLTTWQTIIF